MTVAYLLAQLHGLADGYETGRGADGSSDRMTSFRVPSKLRAWGDTAYVGGFEVYVSVG